MCPLEPQIEPRRWFELAIELAWSDSAWFRLEREFNVQDRTTTALEIQVSDNVRQRYPLLLQSPTYLVPSAILSPTVLDREGESCGKTGKGYQQGLNLL